MKALAIVTAALFFSAAALLPAPPSTCDRSAACVDDPPPERDDCPLCGGNPELHVKRVFALAEIGAWSTANAVPR